MFLIRFFFTDAKELGLSIKHILKNIKYLCVIKK